EGNTITATADEFDTAHGHVKILSNGSYTYTPVAGYDGADSFGFTIQTTDGDSADVESRNGRSEERREEINDLTGGAPTNSTNEGVTVSVRVKHGPSDSEGNTITATADEFDTAHGHVKILSNGSYTYTPVAGYDGADSFGFTIQTTDGDSADVESRNG